MKGEWTNVATTVVGAIVLETLTLAKFDSELIRAAFRRRYIKFVLLYKDSIILLHVSLKSVSLWSLACTVAPLQVQAWSWARTKPLH